MGARATGVMRVTRSPIFCGGPAHGQRDYVTRWRKTEGSSRKFGMQKTCTALAA